MREFYLIPYKENGKSFEGADCWGFVQLYYKHVLNISLPEFSELLWKNNNLISFKDRQKNDILILRGLVLHCGILVEKDKFFHTQDKSGPCMASVFSAQWTNKILGVWRYE